MEVVFRVSLFVTGLVNLLPAFLLFAPGRLGKAYGIEIANVNHELLLRHRAALFALVGGLLIYSSLSRRYYDVAAFTGLFSMLSFVVLYFVVGKGVNAELSKVMAIDAVAVVILTAGLVAYAVSLKNR